MKVKNISKIMYNVNYQFIGGEDKLDQDPSYKKRKVITIGVVSELTGLSERQIRYYEERKLIFPERTNKGNRKYSFSDVECLIEIANKEKKA